MLVMIRTRFSESQTRLLLVSQIHGCTSEQALGTSPGSLNRTEIDTALKSQQLLEERTYKKINAIQARRRIHSR